MSNSFRDVANKNFYSAPKNAKFSIFGPRHMAMAGKKNSCFLARPENNFESKQTYFSYSPNKGFHPPEFQAKLFFTRNWVGGFYWDCLLININFWECFSRWVACNTMYLKTTRRPQRFSRNWSYTHPSFKLFSHIIKVAVLIAKLFRTLISHY